MKSTPTIEFTFESPCPGQLENVVALDLEGDAAPRASNTRAHLARCPRCRAFRDSLQSQGRYVRRWFTDHPVPVRTTRHASPRDDLGLTSWLNDALKRRSERALATDLWRLAAAVYRLDPGVDRQTVFEDEVVRQAPRRAIDAVMKTMLRGWESDAAERSERSEVIERATALVNEVERSGRVAATSRLLELSDQITGRPSSRSLLLQSEVEWHDGADARTTRLLESAYRAAVVPIHRHDAMNNLAVWAFTKRDFEEAKRLATRAIAVDPGSALARTNLAIWSYALGEDRIGGSLLSTIERESFGSRDVAFVARTRTVVRRVEARVGRSPGSLDFILERLTRFRPVRPHEGSQASDDVRDST